MSDANVIPVPVSSAVLVELVRALVDDADAVSVRPVQRGRRWVLEVQVAPGELGRVIGRQGRTAANIRNVVRAAAARDGAEVEVDFVD